ncbi:MAG: porin family protein [Bacteroidota bacterium]
MKKIVLILFLLGSHLVFAQKNIHFGIKGGLNRSQVIGDGNHGYYKTGINGGVFSNLLLNKQWKLQFEILFNDKGSHYNYKDAKNSNLLNLYHIRLYYIEAPILLQYNRKNFFYEFGLGLGYLIDKGEYLDNQSFHNNVYPFNLTEQSFNIGFGYFFNKKVGVNFRYNNSISPIRKVPSTQFNSVFMLALICKIDFTKQ